MPDLVQRAGGWGNKSRIDNLNYKLVNIDHFEIQIGHIRFKIKNTLVVRRRPRQWLFEDRPVAAGMSFSVSIPDWSSSKSVLQLWGGDIDIKDMNKGVRPAEDNVISGATIDCIIPRASRQKECRCPSGHR